MKKALVLGAGGFIGSHMVKRLKNEEYYVVGIDLKKPAYSKSYDDEFHISDLTKRNDFENILKSHKRFDEIYQYAADMGGAAFVFSGEDETRWSTPEYKLFFKKDLMIKYPEEFMLTIKNLIKFSYSPRFYIYNIPSLLQYFYLNLRIKLGQIKKRISI